MKAIMLAAGAGRRLAEMGWTKPKCLLPIGLPTIPARGVTKEDCGATQVSRTLLEYALEALGIAEIEEVVVVVGYQQELVIQAAREAKLRSENSNLKFVSNPHFATTNTLYSLWLAREHLCGDTILLNGDLLFDSRILDLILRCKSSALAIDAHPCGLEEVKVVTDAMGRITRIGKDVPVEQSCGEHIGLGRLNTAASSALRDSLDRRMAGSEFTSPSVASTGTLPPNTRSSAKYASSRPSPSQGEGGGEGRAFLSDAAQLFYESAINDILGDHVVIASPIGNLTAIEIDTPEDYERAQRLGLHIKNKD